MIFIVIFFFLFLDNQSTNEIILINKREYQRNAITINNETCKNYIDENSVFVMKKKIKRSNSL